MKVFIHCINGLYIILLCLICDLPVAVAVSIVYPQISYFLLNEHLMKSSVTIHSGGCKYNPKYFDNFTMSIVNNTINLDMITKKTFDRGYNVHVDFAIRLSRTKQYQRVFAHTMDTCGVVSTIKRNIFKAWFQSMWDRSNFVHSCPVTKGHYFLHNWKVDPQLVPQYLSAGDYRITCHFFYGKLKSKQEEFVIDLTTYAILKMN